MTQMDLLAAAASFLKMMKENKMYVKDIDALEMVRRADALAAEGYQKSYIVEKMSSEYHISVRSVYSTIKRLHSNIV